MTPLLVDARPIEHPTAKGRGIGRWTAGLLQGLHDAGVEAWGLAGSEPEARAIRSVLPDCRIEVHGPDAVRRSGARWYVATGLFLHPLSADPIPSYVTRAGLGSAAILYDAIPYRFPDVYLRTASAARQAALRAVLARTVDLVLSISDFSARTGIETLRLDPHRVVTVGSGVAAMFRTEPRSGGDVAMRAVGGERPYVVTVTGGDEHKNTRRLIEAWASVPDADRGGRVLVITGQVHPSVIDRWAAWAREAGCADRTVFAPSLPDEQLVAVLQHADLAVMPSLEEGFGLPVAEAAACGCPAICSAVSSLPEVLDEPLALFDPNDAADIAAAISAALTDPDRRRALLVAGERAAERWRWPQVARRVADAIGERPVPATRSVRRRVAVVGSGAESFVAGLGECARIDVTAWPDVDEARGLVPGQALGTLLPAHDVDDIVLVDESSPATPMQQRLMRTFGARNAAGHRLMDEQQLLSWLDAERAASAG